MSAAVSTSDSADCDALVVGAGVAGLACAQELGQLGLRAVVVDKARGVGGRCATWRGPSDVPFDYGVTFLHGDDPEFLQAFSGIQGGSLLPGWPLRIEGGGTPCQATAFAPRERRVAVPEGVSAWPKHLARGLDVRLQQRVQSLACRDSQVHVATDRGELRARAVVLTLPCEQLRELLEAWSDRPAVLDGPLHVLSLVGTVPCLTVMAAYDASAAALPWDMLYPADSPVLHLVSNETSKRPAAGLLGLVLQARAAWSRAQLNAPDEQWQAAMLAEASRVVGPWAGRPQWTRAHRWRYARTDLSSELAGPVVVELDGGCQLAIAGELWARGAGVEAAWLSGRRVARLLAEGARSEKEAL